jgi:hypothetical protein
MLGNVQPRYKWRRFFHLERLSPRTNWMKLISRIAEKIRKQAHHDGHNTVQLGVFKLPIGGVRDYKG